MLPDIPSTAKCIIHCRVSTKPQAGEDKASLPEQERAGREWAKENGWTVDSVVVDRASGRDHNRPGFLAMRRHVERYPRKQDRGVVICYDSSRWLRAVDDPELKTFPSLVGSDHRIAAKDDARIGPREAGEHQARRNPETEQPRQGLDRDDNVRLP